MRRRCSKRRRSICAYGCCHCCAAKWCLPHLQLEQPKLALHVDEKGVPNWSFSKNPAAAAAAEVATPDERAEAPIIGELVIKDGHFKYEDDAKDLQLEGDITTATGEAEKTESIKLDAKGKLQGKAMKVEFVGGSILALRDDDTPYPLDLVRELWRDRGDRQGHGHRSVQAGSREHRPDPEGP